jgi:hypothetical protein
MEYLNCISGIRGNNTVAGGKNNGICEMDLFILKSHLKQNQFITFNNIDADYYLKEVYMQ